jgi:hypothetical protein
MRKLKVGDFVKHKDAKGIIFQIVQILDPVIKKDLRMINVTRVNDIYSYLETDLRKYELSDEDCENIMDHNI